MIKNKIRVAQMNDKKLKKLEGEFEVKIQDILDMARDAYQRNSRGDLEFTRPNRPFEK